jgi:hypothetical protein
MGLGDRPEFSERILCPQVRCRGRVLDGRSPATPFRFLDLSGPRPVPLTVRGWRRFRGRRISPGKTFYPTQGPSRHFAFPFPSVRPPVHPTSHRGQRRRLLLHPGRPSPVGRGANNKPRQRRCRRGTSAAHVAASSADRHFPRRAASPARTATPARSCRVLGPWRPLHRVTESNP